MALDDGDVAFEGSGEAVEPVGEGWAGDAGAGDEDAEGAGVWFHGGHGWGVVPVVVPVVVVPVVVGWLWFWRGFN